MLKHPSGPITSITSTVAILVGKEQFSMDKHTHICHCTHRDRLIIIITLRSLLYLYLYSAPLLSWSNYQGKCSFFSKQKLHFQHVVHKKTIDALTLLQFYILHCIISYIQQMATLKCNSNKVTIFSRRTQSQNFSLRSNYFDVSDKYFLTS